METSESYCGYCNVRFTGPAPAKEHYASRGHQKAQLMRTSSPVSTGLGGPPTVSTLATTLPNFHTDSNPQPLCPGGPPDDSKEPYIFDDRSQRGRCNVCRIDLSSVQHKQEHLQGKNHRKKAMFWGMVPVAGQQGSPEHSSSGQPPRAGIEVPLTHRTGAVGKPRFNSTSQVSGLSNVSTGSSPDLIMDWPTPPGPETQPGIFGADASSGNNQSPLHNSFKTGTSQVPTLSYRCQLCDISANTQAQLDMHKMGYKHKKKEAQQHAGLGTVDWHICRICNKQVNSHKQLRIHIASHETVKDGALKNLLDPVRSFAEEELKSDNQDLLVNLENHLALYGGPLKVPSPDRTVWYPCRMCQKKVNSIIQLKVHYRSHNLPDVVVSEYLSNPTPCSSEGLSTATSAMPASKLTSDQLLTTNVSSSVATSSCSLPSTKQRFDHEEFYKGSLDGITIVRRPEKIGQKSCEGHSPSRQRQVRPMLDMSEEAWRSPRATIKEEDGRKDISQGLDKLTHTLSNIQSKTETATNYANIGSALNENSSLPNIHPGVPNLLKPVVNDSVIDQLSSAVKDLITFDDSNEEMPMVRKEEEQSADVINFFSSGECSYPNCEYHCILCDTHLSGIRPKEDHMDSAGHLKKIKKMNENPEFHQCRICDVAMNSEKAYQSHIRGRQHKANFIRRQQAPEKDFPSVVRSMDLEQCQDMAYEMTSLFPRKYQVELFTKALNQPCNGVCFLPTGTGKTLVATLVVGALLDLNPKHNVLFLVDKVLLVLQQADVFKKQLGAQLLNRWAEETERETMRPVRVAGVCGGEQDVVGEDLPLWKHDVIVATAGYYKNLLNHGSMRWEYHCLVVIDEAHHTIRDHPFNNILTNYHHPLPAEQKPKILGLTASPAGRDSTKNTLWMLQGLMRNLGEAKMLCVTENLEELSKYRCSTGLEPREVAMSQEEARLQGIIYKYFDACNEELKKRTNLQNLLELNAQVVDIAQSPTPGNDKVLRQVDDFQYLVDKVKINDREESMVVRALIMHVKVLCRSLCALEQFGVESAYEELLELQKDSNPGNFTLASRLSLPNTDLQGWLERQMQIAQVASVSPNNDVVTSPMLFAIVSEIINLTQWENLERLWSEPPMVLVLVKRRCDAKFMAHILARSPELIQRNISVTYIIGHGNDNDGMSVPQQKKRLTEITEKKHNVIVATSVAEEGIDLPECELVVQCEVPSSVRALVQIRGRARKVKSRFVVLCRRSGQKQELEDLLQRETSMMEAVNELSNLQV